MHLTGGWSAFENQDDPNANLNHPHVADGFPLDCRWVLAEIVTVVRSVVEEAGQPDGRLYQRLPLGHDPPYLRIPLEPGQ
jgi:hypothetical protein